ncbi:hypothetical protein Syun_002713 [Stephania yunnanensis]|uniref:Uncharacterized protein n=1 Tax=Stephania yunnanensis TaxID=152371 RepID=A0AAP0Q8A8_9MAGN
MEMKSRGELDTDLILRSSAMHSANIGKKKKIVVFKYRFRHFDLFFFLSQFCIDLDIQL